MKEEIRTAVNFFQKHLNTSSSLSTEQTQKFRDELERLVTDRFQNHWHPSKPLKGNAYRCINIERTQIDPLLVKAADESNVPLKEVMSIFPDGFALWIDPDDVAVRFGTHGSIYPIYGKELRNLETTRMSSERKTQGGSPFTINKIQHQFNPHFFSQFTSHKNQQRYHFAYYNKENFDRYHWTNREYMKRTTQVY